MKSRQQIKLLQNRTGYRNGSEITRRRLNSQTYRSKAIRRLIDIALTAKSKRQGNRGEK
jgi:hypothetical protein